MAGLFAGCVLVHVLAARAALMAKRVSEPRRFRLPHGNPTTLHEHRGKLTSAAFSPCGQQAWIGDERGGLTVWNLQRGKVLRRCDAHHGRSVESIVFA
eukprot:CAMPEP_0198515960 /NCGR_PEP_ID=MMETSP1462-20131121/17627_1 /TAXON_ID=1333877 /ORGANISM="Brandtodinium nutriculum, Strain RCC3387" /LENGTH=97 /DNA_ID=CAMNT_0044245473 /DNA_START=4 /DNA_END=293 /DNA_ORIENTATION=+